MYCIEEELPSNCNLRRWIEAPRKTTNLPHIADRYSVIQNWNLQYPFTLSNKRPVNIIFTRISNIHCLLWKRWLSIILSQYNVPIIIFLGKQTLTLLNISMSIWISDYNTDYYLFPYIKSCRKIVLIFMFTVSICCWLQRLGLPPADRSGEVTSRGAHSSRSRGHGLR